MTEPTDNELDALILQHWPAAATATLPLRWIRAAFREGLAKWGTRPIISKISIPTATMEQEFQNHYRMGYEAGKKAGTPAPVGVEPLIPFRHGCKWCGKTTGCKHTPQSTQAQAGAVPLDAKEGAEHAALVCESRARSLSFDGDHAAANEARKCAGAIRSNSAIVEIDDPMHPRYIAGFKAGHAAGRKRGIKGADHG
jgi:hypothetical protein